MANTYYSGQGRFYVADRDGSGNPTGGFTLLGNVPSLSIDIETTKFEHKESKTGSRLLDLTVIQEKKGTFTMTLENLNTTNLAMALFGTETVHTGAVEAEESIVAAHDKPVALAWPNVSVVTYVDDNAGGATPFTEGTDYTVDLVNGTITVLSTGTIADTTPLFVQYTTLDSTQVDSFINTTVEKWLRFEGLNTIDDTSVIVDIFKASFDPLSGYELINEEIAAVELTGSILADDLRQSGSEFFRQTNFDPTP